MSTHDEIIRNTRRMAGLPVEDTSEEVMVISPKRTPEFVVSEVQDLSGLHDYRPGIQTERYALSFAVQMGVEARKMGESLAKLSAHTDQEDIAVAAAKAAKALKELHAVTKSKR